MKIAPFIIDGPIADAHTSIPWQVNRGGTMQSRCDHFGRYPDPTQMAWIKDDFLGSSNVGELNWVTQGTFSYSGPISGEANHPGVHQLLTPAVSAYYGMRIHADTNPVLPADYFNMTFIIKIGSTADADYRFGLIAGATNISPSALHIIGFQKLTTDSNWRTELRNGSGTESSGILTMTADTSWHTFRIWRFSATQICWNIDGGNAEYMGTYVPTVVLTPFLQVRPTVAVSKNINIDYFDLGVKVSR